MRIFRPLLCIAIFAVAALPVTAAKPRIRTKTAGKSTAASGISYSSVRISRPAHGIVLSLSNLSGVKKVSYELSYEARELPQGVMGAITVNGQTSDSRDLYFGTCSKQVCTPHTDITNAVLTVRVQKNSGAVAAKRYRINTRF